MELVLISGAGTCLLLMAELIDFVAPARAGVPVPAAHANTDMATAAGRRPAPRGLPMAEDLASRYDQAA